MRERHNFGSAATPVNERHRRLIDKTRTKGNRQSCRLDPTTTQKIAAVVAEILGMFASWAYAHAGDARRTPRTRQ